MAQQTTSRTATTPAELVEHLMQFDGPPEEFLMQLLTVQCHVGAADQGVILRASRQGRPEVLALYPRQKKSDAMPDWLSQAIELSPNVLTSGRGVTAPLRSGEELYGVAPSRYLLVMPILGGAGVRGVAAFIINNGDTNYVEQCRQRLELTVSLLSLYELRLTIQRRGTDLERLKQACEVLAELNKQDKYKAAAMAMCNQIADAWKADRVTLGLLKGRYVKSQALSHTEKYSRKQNIVQAIEATMEECIDQDIEVAYPSDAEATTVCRAAKELSTKFGPTAVLSLPLRRGDEPIGVMTIEWAPEHVITIEEIETLRLTCDLCTARVSELEQRDRWVGQKALDTARKGGSKLVGPTHTWAKIVAIVLLGLIIFFSVAQGTYKVEAPFVVEPVKRQIVGAPYNGKIDQVLVEPGDRVTEGQLIASMDRRELVNQRDQKRAEINRLGIQMNVHKQKGEIPEALVAQAQINGLRAELNLVNKRITESEIRAPINGIIIAGDLKRQVGITLNRGQTLFEIAPLQNLKVELDVTEDQMAELEVGQTGELAAVSHPGTYFKFKVTRIEPAAGVVEQKNVFKVRGEFVDTPPTWFRPGMKGLGKVHIDQRSYLEIWTKPIVNWIKMKLWI